MCPKVVGAVSASASATHGRDGVSAELNDASTWTWTLYGRTE